MSENIQSISQGTYTIGQTSATNFIAGNGIKIDEPSAGTVRIGNDETVLWTGNKDETGGGNKNHWNIVLSEPVSAFERLRIHYMQQIGNIRDYASIEIDVYDNSAAYRVPAWPENKVSSNWMSMNIQLTGNSGFYEGAYNPWSENVNNPALKNYWLAGNFNKVVGINRISGSNA